jgi:RNA polymerase sigma factor (sigma-70 family)
MSQSEKGLLSYDDGRPVTSAFFSVEKKLRSYLMRYLVREQDVEDTVQETFLRAYESELKSEIRCPKSFLFKIARNLALSELSRKTQSMMVLVEDLEALDYLEEEAMEDQLHFDQSLDALLRTIQTLPPKCQRVLLMRKVYGFSHKEIARRMDISVKTVERHLTKALERCQHLSQFDPENEFKREPAVPVVTQQDAGKYAVMREK